MGTCCSRVLEEPQIPNRNWSKSYLAQLKLYFPEREEETWYSETVKIARSWSKAISIYLRRNRWAPLSRLSSPVQQQYLVARRSSALCSLNVYDMLSADFYDPNNPIASLLCAFSRNYADSLDDSASLQEIAATVLRYVEVISACILEIYKVVETQLANSKQNLDGLVLARLVQGKLFRRIEDIALMQCGELEKHHLTVQCVGQEIFTSSAEIACREVEDLLRTFVSSENLFEKLYLLQEVDVQLATQPDKSRLRLAAYAVTRTGLRQLPAHLLMTRCFYSASPRLLDEAVSLLFNLGEAYTRRLFSWERSARNSLVSEHDQMMLCG